jgi:enoyl-CoA hydratase
MGGLLSGGGATDGPKVSGAVRARNARDDILRLQAAITAVAQCPKPVIAAVHGYCIGGGVDLIAACDIRLASADAIFSVREAKVAIVADLGSLQRLPSIIGAG